MSTLACGACTVATGFLPGRETAAARNLRTPGKGRSWNHGNHEALTRWLRGAAAVLMLALLGACSTYPSPGGLTIDHSIQAKSQNSRVEFVVLHYTSSNNGVALKTLSQGNVSSHYLITDDPTPHVYQLVGENRRAWHAGVSQWYGSCNLNSASIGIEIVNEGGSGQVWAPYSEAQIAVLKVLLRDIVQRHQIKAANIVGHSDIAPQRKVDPGPLFPWKELARAGLGRWYDEDQVAGNIRALERSGMPTVRWFQQELVRVGYAAPSTGVLDKATRNVLRAFQMHYRPSRYDGRPDIETAAILQTLQ